MKTMTEAEAIEWVYSQDESQEVDQDQLEAAFAALHGRPADDEDRQNGLWSLCCNRTPNCGTRPEPACSLCRGTGIIHSLDAAGNHHTHECPNCTDDGQP